jgi:glycosyltransferase involved in cell wall biosynthesis
MKRLAIITSHPIQYNAPWFKLLAQSKEIRPKVFYTWEQTGNGAKYDPEFGKEIEWDIPLLEGYEYVFVKNIASDPGTHHFKGLINPSLNKEVGEWEPDAILVFGWSFVSHLSCIRYFHKKLPVLFRGDSTLLNETPGIKKQLRRLFLKWVYRHIDYALFVGKHNKDYFLKHGLQENQLIYAPHAIDNERFAEPDAVYNGKARQWRNDLGISENELVLLFAGKLEYQKNPFFLVEMMKGIKSDKVKIVFAGNGALEKDLKKAAAEDSRILFIDFQNQLQMPVVYRLGDIFILPSVSETWGLGANEAMASGCAVMMSEKAGGSIDLIQEGRNGIIFKTTDFEKCRHLIEQLAMNREELVAMKAASHLMILAFSYKHIVEALEGLLTNL